MVRKMKSYKDDKPKVSIIVVVTGNRGFDSIFDSLDSFYPQEGDINFEFIVVDERNQEREKNLRERFPWVRLIQTEELMPAAYLRNIALLHVRGEIIAFADDHVFFHNNYIKKLVAGFSKGYDIVGGPVANGNPGTLAGWVSYFCEFHKWLPTKQEGEVEDLPGTNFAYRFDLLKKLGPFPEGRFKLEYLFNKRARQGGNRFYFSPSLKIAHINEVKISDFWVCRFNYGRLLATRRGFPVWKRVAYAILSPLIALIEYIRIFNHARCDRTYLQKFVQCTPLLLPTLFIWMAGECTGYLFGAKDLKDAT